MVGGRKHPGVQMVAPPATRRPDPRHIATPLPAPLLCSAAPPGGSRAHVRAPDRRSILSIPRTPAFRNASRRPTRLTFAVAGTTAAAAALVAVGLATATPGGPGAANALGTVLAPHSGTQAGTQAGHGALPLAQLTLDQPGGAAASAGGSAAAHRAAGASPVTATGWAILASGRAAAHAAPARSGKSGTTRSGHQAPSAHPARAAGQHASARPDGHAKPDAAPRSRPAPRSTLIAAPRRTGPRRRTGPT